MGRYVSNMFEGASVVALLAYICLILAGLAGYVMNIFAIVGSLSGEVTTLLVVRIIGCFAFPLGAILGWF